MCNILMTLYDLAVESRAGSISFCPCDAETPQQAASHAILEVRNQLKHQKWDSNPKTLKKMVSSVLIPEVLSPNLTYPAFKTPHPTTALLTMTLWTLKTHRGPRWPSAFQQPRQDRAVDSKCPPVSSVALKESWCRHMQSCWMWSLCVFVL